ncbi:MAG TPA: 16S rRNA (uracil(1498)-N(3))-methyltransferase, partial [Clostridia bacterium]|nr:16S rRNA (uracil(1498)-N(3))-methyltransferase [Clostridia bacterium]
MAHHFIVPPEQVGAEEIVITGSDLEHLVRVLRLKPGAIITVSDGRGWVYRCLLQQVTKDKAVGLIQEACPDDSEPPIRLMLLQGLPKGDKLELIIQKATELGVADVLPVAMERSVVKLSGEKAGNRVTRWQRIALEAAKQCRRNRAPVVHPVMTLAGALDFLPPATAVLVPWEDEKARGLREVLTSPAWKEARTVALVIGPEGGMTGAEVELALARG